MGKRRSALLVVAVGIAWSLVATSPVSAADEQKQGNTTGVSFVQNIYLWAGATGTYGQVESTFSITVAAGTTAYMRWECQTRNGPTDTIGGPQTRTVNGATFNGAGFVLAQGDLRCAYHVWSAPGSAGFRINGATMLFWLSEFEGGGGDNGSGGPMTPPPPGSSASPGPGTDATPPPGDPGEDGTEDNPWQFVCANGVGTNGTGGCGSATSPAYVIPAGHVMRFTVTDLDGSPGKRWCGFTGGYDYIGCYTLNHIPTLPPLDEWVYLMGSDDPDLPDLSGGAVYLDPGGPDEGRIFAVPASASGGTYGYCGSPPCAWTAEGVLLETDSLEPPEPPEECDIGQDADCDGYSDEVEAGAGTDPNDDSSYPGSTGPGPTPPPWYVPPPPPLGQPTPGPFLGGNGGIKEPNPRSPNKTGIEACDADDGGYSKPGQAPLQALPNTSFPGSANPLDYIPWVGNLIATVPITVGNTAQWSVNTGIDLVVPGPCVATLVTDAADDLMEKAPFSIVGDTSDLITGAMSGAGSISAPSATIAGTTITLPLSDMADDVAPWRPWMGAIVWLFGLIGIMRLVLGTAGVSNGGGGS